MNDIDIKWLKAHGFKRDTKCREAVTTSSSGEAWKRGFVVDKVNFHSIERKKYYCIVFKYKHSWLADFGHTAHWYGSEEAQYPQEAIRLAIEKFIRWRDFKIAELSDERIAAASLKQELLNEKCK